MNSMDNRLSHHNHQKSPNMFPKSCSARMSSFPFLGRSKNLSFSRCPIFTALAEGTSSTNTVLSAGVPSSKVLTFGVVEHAPPLKWVQYCPIVNCNNFASQSLKYSYPSGCIKMRKNTICRVLIAITEKLPLILWQILCIPCFHGLKDYYLIN